MNINCNLFRLSTYLDHEVTGAPPKRRLSFVQYRSGDNGGRQWNGSLTIGLTTFHLKVRRSSTTTNTNTPEDPKRG